MHRHKKVKGPIFIRAKDPVLCCVLFSISGYITAIYRRWSIHKRKFLVFVECKEPEASHLVTETNLLLYQLHSPKSLCGVCLQLGRDEPV